MYAEMDKGTRAGEEVISARHLLHSLIQEQSAETEELRASSRELQSILDDFLGARGDLRAAIEAASLDRVEEAAAATRSHWTPEELSASQLKRDAERVLGRAREAIRESALLRLKAQRLREALRLAPVRRPKTLPPAQALSKREKQVLDLIVAGKTSKQIAVELGISFKTAVTHRSSIMSKLDVHELASVVREAIRRGLV